LIPVPDEIRLLRDEIFSTSGAVGPAAVSGDDQALMEAENARVSVQNGSGVEGIAGKTSEWLRTQNIDVVDESNADDFYDTTTIFIYNGKPTQYSIYPASWGWRIRAFITGMIRTLRMTSPW